VAEVVEVPVFDQLKIVETFHRPDGWRENQRLQIKKSDLKSIHEYSSTFHEQLNAGYSWINLSILGMYDNILLVVVELPNKISGSRRTSINFSGPQEVVMKNSPKWDIVTCYDLLD